MVKVHQKISDGWRTVQWVHLSTSATRQGKNLLHVTRRPGDGPGAWISTPS